ncbi:MAG: hypothetical protein LCH56_06520 [Proteobacteria bacterium]|nr:hypothetical protein [Pseudomonadota bacterium]
MARFRDPKDIWDVLLIAPWWVAFALGLIAIVFCRFYLPTVEFQSIFFRPLVAVLSGNAYVAAAPFFIVSACSFFVTGRD